MAPSLVILPNAKEEQEGVREKRKAPSWLLLLGASQAVSGGRSAGPKPPHLRRLSTRVCTYTTTHRLISLEPNHRWCLKTQYHLNEACLRDIWWPCYIFISCSCYCLFSIQTESPCTANPDCQNIRPRPCISHIPRRSLFL